MSPDNPTFPVRRYADPPFPGGFLLMGSGCLGLANIGTVRAGLRAHGERARLSSAHQPHRLCAYVEGVPALTTWPVAQCSRESEQSENGAGEMVPLYAARIGAPCCMGTLTR